ncbi:unnamed protein product [Boreogadus saida]
MIQVNCASLWTLQSIAKILLTSCSGGGNLAAALQLSSGSTIPFSAVQPSKLRRQSGGGDMEEKGIVLQELSCRTAAKLPPPDCRRSFGGRRRQTQLPAAAEASAAVRQCTPGAELRPKLFGCSGGCTPGAELPPKLAGPAGVGLGGSLAAQLREYNP